MLASSSSTAAGASVYVLLEEEEEVVVVLPNPSAGQPPPPRQVHPQKKHSATEACSRLTPYALVPFEEGEAACRCLRVVPCGALASAEEREVVEVGEEGDD